MGKVLLLTILYALSVTSAINQTKASHVRKCPNFKDTRIVPTENHLINLPASLTSQAAYSSPHSPIQLSLQPFGEENSSNLPKCCNDTAMRVINWTNSSKSQLSAPRNFHDVSSGSSNRHMHFYFTQTGHFYDAISGNYYRSTDQYCVQSISDDNISVRICVNFTQNYLILPKCCAIDETLLFWRRQCVRLNETLGKTPWQPPIYKSIANPNTKIDSKTNIIYRMTELPKNCTLIKYSDGSFEEQGFVWLSASKVEHYKNKSLTQEKDNIRLILPENNGGNIEVIVLNDASRKWLKLGQENFCVDGFHYPKEEKIYSGKPNNFVVFYCHDEVIKENERPRNEDELEWKSRIYVGFSLVALMFLLATIIVYVLLWDNHMLKDMIITCYIISTFGSYLFLTIAHMIFLYPNPEMTGLHTRGPFCYTVATLAHYFYLSSYLWLTVMNFDIWITFKSVHYVKRDIKQSKGWCKFAMYSCVGWIFPASLIVAFAVIDYLYRDPLTEIPVPDYALGTCFVSPEFRGEYVYTPMCILLAINVVLIGMTMGIFIGARSQATTFKTGGMPNVNNYNAKLFGKIFVLMGGTYTIEFVTWYYNNNADKPWHIVGFEVLNNFTPVILFYILCWNDKIIKQLREKYPKFSGGKQ